LAIPRLFDVGDLDDAPPVDEYRLSTRPGVVGGDG
jgi:hypothetical protein